MRTPSLIPKSDRSISRRRSVGRLSRLPSPWRFRLFAKTRANKRGMENVSAMYVNNRAQRAVLKSSLLRGNRQPLTWLCLMSFGCKFLTSWKVTSRLPGTGNFEEDGHSSYPPRIIIRWTGVLYVCENVRERKRGAERSDDRGSEAVDTIVTIYNINIISKEVIVAPFPCFSLAALTVVFSPGTIFNEVERPFLER